MNGTARLQRILLALVIALFAAIAASGVWNAKVLTDQNRLVSHTIRVRGAIAEIRALITEAESGQRGYLITGDQNYLKPYAVTMERVNGRLEDLRKLTADNPVQQTSLDELERRINERATTLRALLMLADSQGLDSARAALPSGGGGDQMDAVRALLEEMDAHEARLMEVREPQAAKSYAWMLVSIISGAAIGIALVGLAYFRLGSEATYRRRAAAAIVEQREWFRTTLASIGDAVIATDTDGSITYVNSVASALTGWTADDAHGKQLSDVLKIVHEQMRTPAGNPALQALASARDVRPENHVILISKDGTERPIDDSAAPIRKADGTVIGVVVIFRDVSQRRAAEGEAVSHRRLVETIVNTASAGMFMLDPQNRCTYVNAAGETLIGYSLEELVARNESLHDVIHHSRPDGTPFPSSECPVSRSTSELHRRSGEVEFIYSDGTFFPAAYTASPILEHDRLVGTVLEIRDLTVEKQMELDRKLVLEREHVLRRRAEDANRLKDDFLATISHELRTPLNAILGWSRILNSNLADANLVKRGVETIERNSRAQAHLIEDLLDISRITQGTLRLNVGLVDPARVIDLALDSVRLAAEARQIELVSQSNTEAAAVSGDPQRLQQVVWNLLSNAIKFTPEGGRVEVALSRDDSHVAIMVTDTGRGIAAEFLPFIFDRFRQADSSTSRGFGGVGLGLAIARQLVELHGGSIEAKSAGLDQGATFVARLPIAGTVSARLHDDAPLGEPEPHARAVLADSDALAGMRIAVVDDEEDAREMLEQILGSCGAEVRTASTAREGRELVRTWVPDVLISDLAMPDGDGHSLIREIRLLPAREGGAVPAIALTAYARMEDRIRALMAGFQMHVAKPIEPSELVMVVASVASFRSARRP